MIFHFVSLLSASLSDVGGVVAFLVVAGVGVQTRLRVRVVVKLRKQVRDLTFKIEGGG